MQKPPAPRHGGIAVPLLFASITAALPQAASAAPPKGLVLANSGSAVLIDSARRQLGKGVTGIPSGGVVGDCTITPDGTTAFVTTFNHEVFPIDLGSDAPVLGAAIATGQPTEDVSLTPDGKYLLVSDGSLNAPISVIDVALRTKLWDFTASSAHTSVEVCDDGTSVLYSDSFSGTLGLLKLAKDGSLSDAGFATAGAWTNAYCAPGSHVAVVNSSGGWNSYTLPGLSPVGSVTSTDPQSGTFSPDGQRFYARGQSAVQAFAFDPQTGQFGAELWTASLPPYAASYFGIEQIAVTPDGKELYVTHGDQLSALDAQTGQTLVVLEAPELQGTTGVCFGAGGSDIPRDFGDAPDPMYPTLIASGGASHGIGALFLGAKVDVEADGQPAAAADGDDRSDTDDEDGITLGALRPGASNPLKVSVSGGPGKLDAWIDVNADGDWDDAGERIFEAQAVVTGVNNLVFTLPAAAAPGTSFARFRLSSDGVHGAFGDAPDGEVEDYPVTIYGERPRQFRFVDQSDVPPSSPALSNVIKVSGTTQAVPVSIRGGVYSINQGPFTNAAGTVVAGDKLRVRHRSAAQYSRSVNTTLDIGGVSDTFTSTTVAADSTPDSFHFQDLDEVPLRQLVNSSGITVQGINVPASISVQDGEYRINADGAWTTQPGTVSNGMQVQLRHYSSSLPNTTTSTTLSISGVTDSFTTRTRPSANTVPQSGGQDLVPERYTFTDAVNVAISTAIESDTVQIRGISAPTPVRVQGGAYSIDGGPFVSTDGVVGNGALLRLRHTSAAMPDSSMHTTIDVGGITDTFSSTTQP